MRKLRVFCHGKACGVLDEMMPHNRYSFTYDADYNGPPISLTMPVHQNSFTYDCFPPFFDGLLPEGLQLEGLVRHNKLAYDDYMSQLEIVGSDLIGAVTVHSIKGSK